MFAHAQVNDPEQQGNWYKHTGSSMGTLITIEFWHDDSKEAKRFINGVMGEMDRVDKLMSPYIPSAELARINKNAFLDDVEISNELFRLIQLAIKHGQWSEGTFDITFASVGHQYDYRESVKPNESQLQQTLELIDYQSILLNESQRSIRFLREGTRIDLGGIAKGYAVDRAAIYLYQQGIRNATVSAGGDSRIIGDHRGRPWMMGIKDPRGDGHIVSLPLEEVSISTSGDYERYFIDQSGIRHHHIINPKNGLSASTVRSVTILGPNATMTDALSTTVFVMGVEKGLDYINGIEDVSAVIIDAHGKLHYSNDLVRPERKRE